MSTNAEILTRIHVALTFLARASTVKMDMIEASTAALFMDAINQNEDALLATIEKETWLVVRRVPRAKELV